MDEENVGAHQAVFSFISDQEFRDSLASDYAELLKSLDSGAWKAVHVLAGSVVEALVIDFLVSLDYAKKSGKDPLELDLAKGVDACKKEGVLSDRAADLATVIRGYRNLIHPGRLIRLKETVDRNSAAVAKALVDMVTSDVAKARVNKYGLTADQLLLKIEQDSSCLPILSHLLKDMSQYERERLLMDVLPAKHLANVDDGYYPLEALEKCFRLAFDSLSDERKAVIARRFVTILRQEPEQEVLDYERAFFRASHIQYLPDSEAAIVLDHLLAQMRSLDAAQLLSLSGLAKFLEGFQLSVYFGYLLRAAVHERDVASRNKVSGAVCNEYAALDESRRTAVMEQVEGWRKIFEEKGDSELTSRTASLITDMREWLEIPF